MQAPHDTTTVVIAIITAGISLATSVATLFAAVLNTPIKYWFEKHALRSKLSIEYEYEQRRKLRDLISRYRGLLIEAAERLNHRFWNFYQNEQQGWLKISGDYVGGGYYFRTWILRLLNLFAIARTFEKESLFIDEGIAEKKDFDFLHMVKSWSWVLSDVSLFDGISYDESRSADHIFHDTLRRIGDVCWINGAFISQEQLIQLLSKSEDLHPICRLLDGLQSQENRLRWDRLVCLHLMVMLFINSFGYPLQQSSEDQLIEVMNKIRNKQIARNLSIWMPRLGLNRVPQGQFLLKALAKPDAKSALSAGKSS